MPPAARVHTSHQPPCGYGLDLHAGRQNRQQAPAISSMNGLLWAALLASLVVAATSDFTVIYDSDASAYLQSSSEAVDVDGMSLGGIISALTGLMPSSQVDTETVCAVIDAQYMHIYNGCIF